MQELVRTIEPLECLGLYRHGQNNWDELTSDERREIWTSLIQMQGERCAYCQRDIKSGDRHIEHFVRKEGSNHSSTFEWTNLFGSCNSPHSCGHFKDRGGKPYEIKNIIKPDSENPEEFFLFASDGSISIRQADSNSVEYFRATETIRVFNLDAKYGPLRSMRQAACAGYIRFAEEVNSMLENATAEHRVKILEFWLEYTREELEASKEQPFSTAIKHTLLPSQLHF